MRSPATLSRRYRSIAPRWILGLLLMLVVGVEASAQLPRSRFLEPQRSTFRPTPGERNPFTPVRLRPARPTSGEDSLGTLQPSLGPSTPARYLPPAEPEEKTSPISGDSFRLSGVLLDDKTPLAVIDGHSYTVGDKVPYEGNGIALEFTVTAIEDRQATLTCQEVTVVVKMKGAHSE